MRTLGTIQCHFAAVRVWQRRQPGTDLGGDQAIAGVGQEVHSSGRQRIQRKGRGKQLARRASAAKQLYVMSRYVSRGQLHHAQVGCSRAQTCGTAAAKWRQQANLSTAADSRPRFSAVSSRPDFSMNVSVMPAAGCRELELISVSLRSAVGRVPCALGRHVHQCGL
jgi:hypothetical protein